MGRKKEFKAAAPDTLMEHSMAKPSHDHEAESAWGDLMRAQEHKSNPELMKRAMKHGKKKKKHMINSLADLKVAASSRRKELQEGTDHDDDDADLDD